MLLLLLQLLGCHAACSACTRQGVRPPPAASPALLAACPSPTLRPPPHPCLL